jgi:hypothetical protein
MYAVQHTTRHDMALLAQRSSLERKGEEEYLWFADKMIGTVLYAIVLGRGLLDYIIPACFDVKNYNNHL